jgi:hypothetical protein
MRYFMTIMPPKDVDSGTRPVPQALMDAMGPYIEKVVASGALISTGGLKNSGTGVRLTGNGDRISVMDGPFTESKEIVGGYAVFECPSKAEAIQAATDFVNLHIEHGMPDIVVEVREIAGGYNF